MSGRFSRKLLCLALACAGSATALAGPTGPKVNAGSASYDPATLTVTTTSARTQINWQSFNVAAGEVVNFVQPNAHSVVLNNVFNPRALNIQGGLNSNGNVLFMSDGRVTGAGLNLDLAGMVATSLRLPKMTLASSGVDALAQPKPLATLAAGSVYVISQDEHALTAANGEVVLNPGRSVELVGVAMTSLRVELTAPADEAINLSRWLAGKRELGIFAGLFRAPAAARQAVQRDAEAVLTASANARALQRFYRYALVHARMRGDSGQLRGGLLQVAAMPMGRAMPAAIEPRPSLLPRAIEIGALRPQDPAPHPASSPPARVESSAAAWDAQDFAGAAEGEVQTDSARLQALASAEPPAELVATRRSRPATVAAASLAQTDDAILLAFTSVEPPAEMVATPNAKPSTVGVAGAAQPDSTSVLWFASVEPPAEMVATPNAHPLAVAGANAAQTDIAAVLAFAPVEPPAEMVAARNPVRVAIAAASAAQTGSAPLLALAPAEPPARLVQQDAGPAARRAAPLSAPVVVALAQPHAAPASREESTVKEVRIERRAPRYFTDYRGALFFM